MKIKNWMYMAPDNGDGGSNGGATTTTAPATTTTTAAPNPSATTTTATAPDTTTTTTTAPATKGSEGGYWADDWRQKLAGNDEKQLKQLGRYQSPEDIWKKARSLEQRLSSGELKSNLPKNAGDEEVKAWRAENGIPETPDKYDLDLGNGVKIGDADGDKELIAAYLKSAHESNQTPDQVKATLRSYREFSEALASKRAEEDRQAQLDGEEELRAEWGPEFRRDINLIHGLLDKSADAELKDKFLGGRLADGTPIGSSPAALKFLLGLALLDNPTGTIVPNGGGDIAASIGDEIDKIEKVMKENRTAYNKDEKMQARYRELLGAREQLNKRK